MSFKCPKCKKDFGYEREELEKHLVKNKECLEKSISLLLDNMHKRSKGEWYVFQFGYIGLISYGCGY